MKCVYNFDGNMGLSSSELDLILLQKLGQAGYNVEVADATLNAPAQETARQRLETLQQLIASKRVKIEKVRTNSNGDPEIETRAIIPGSIGVTRCVETYGDPTDLSKPLITPFNKEQFFADRRRTVYKDLSDEEFAQIRKNWEKSWDLITSTGIGVHKLLELLIKHNEATVDDFKQAIKDTNSSLSAEVLELVDDAQIQDMISIFRNVISKIKTRFGENCQMFSEVPIISKNLASEYQNLRDNNGNPINSINGVIDLLVIDSKGVAHIFDLKTSINRVGRWGEQINQLIGENTWPTSKKNKIGYQLAFYRAILEQWGFSVGATEIIPMHLDTSYNDDRTLKKCQTVSLDTSTEGLHIEYGRDKVRRILDIRPLTESVDLTQAYRPLSIIAPTMTFSQNVQRNAASLARYKAQAEFIPQSSDERSKGQWKFYHKYQRKYVYCRDEADLEQKLEEFIKVENEHRADEISDIATRISNAIRDIRAQQNPDIALSPTNYRSDNEYLYKIFKKYIYGGWDLVDNQTFLAAGLFVFVKNGVLEIVSLTHESIHQINNLGLGSSILGAKKRDSEVDENTILKASGGNLDLIKVMFVLNTAPDLLNNFLIGKVSSYNPWTHEGTETYNEVLYKNFQEICSTFQFECKLQPQHFQSTLKATMQTIEDVLDPELYKDYGTWGISQNPNDLIDNRERLLNMMEYLRKLPNNRSTGLNDAIENPDRWNFDDPVQLSYMLLGRALNQLNGYTMHVELDPKLWFNVSKDGFYSGTMFNSAYNSESLNMRVVSKIISVAQTHINREQLKYDTKIRNAITKLYKAKGQNRLIGGEVSFFKNMFAVDQDGNISQKFRLKNPNDSSLSPEESEFIRTFLQIVNDFRYPTPQAQERAQNDGSWYDVPLAVGSFQSKRSTKGFINAIRAEIRDNFDLLRIFPEQDVALQESKRERKVYNKYAIDSTTRERMLERNGAESFETQLEILLRDVVYTYCNAKVMREFIPRLEAIRIGALYQQAVLGIPGNYKVLLDNINEILSVNVYSTPVMDSNLRVPYQIASVAKNITTATALGFNYNSGIRELLQGAWIQISRAAANAYGGNQFNKKDLAWAWNVIFRDMVKNANTLTLVDALNVEYGMANADPKQVQERLRQSKNGALNFNSDMLYVCNKIPDTYHRMGFLLAKMKADGCFDAHTLVDDQLVYDFKKDKRFSLLNDPNANKDSEEYKHQRGLYLSLLTQFNNEGFALSDGDALPRAYTIQESTSVKSFAELCFGHYDPASQMLLKNHFLGALVLHFKTFISAKLETWILKPGTYNQGMMEQKYDENGEPYVMIFYEEDGITKSRIALKSEVQDGDNWVYYKEWKGRFMEGIAYTMWDFGKALLNRDWQEWKELWANDTKRSNFKLFLIDMGLMALIAYFLRQWLIANDDDLTPVSYTAVNSLQQSFADANILQVISSSAFDLNPPMAGIISNWWKQTSGLITGDKSLAEAATGSFGALRSFKYAIDTLA